VGKGGFGSASVDKMNEERVGAPKTGAPSGRVAARRRVPLKGTQIMKILALIKDLRARWGDKRALQDPRFRTLLRLLRAHTRPVPGSNLTFAQAHAIKLQMIIYQILKTRQPMPQKLVEAMAMGLTIGKPRHTKADRPGTKDQGTAGAQENPFLLPADARIPIRRPDPSQWKPTAVDSSLLLEERQSMLEDYASRVRDPKSNSRALLKHISVDMLSKQRALRARIHTEHALADRDGRFGSRNRERALRTLQRELERVDRTRTKLLEQEEAERRTAKAKWINALNNHITGFIRYRDSARRQIRNVNRGVMKHHDDVARIADRAEREAEKKRIQMLKENDEEGYLELVRKTKNARLLEVLSQTDSYLKELSKTLKDERLESGDAVDEDEMDDDSRKYKEIAHARTESITDQPTILEFGTLKQYQREGLQWMVSLYNNRLNGILADEMGLGKTVQTIALICHLVEKKQNPGPYLVIVPLSTMNNWESEFDRWAPKLQYIVYAGDKKHRRTLYENHLQKNTVNVCLATFEYVLRGKGSLGQIKWQYIIIDEGHRIKNHESKLSTILAQQYTSRNRLLLTGTPLQNSLGELWALLNFLLPKVFKSCDTFENWFSAPFENMPEGEQQANQILSEEESLLIIRRLHQVLQPFVLRRLKSDVLKMGEQLPTKQEDIILCDMSAWQQHTYARIVKQEPVLFTNEQGKTCYDKLSNPAMQMRKIVNHPYLFHVEYSYNVDDGPELWRASGKFNMLDACILKLLKTDHRVLVFNQMVKVVDLQERLLRYRDIPFLRLDGNTKPEERSALVKEFNSPETKYHVFLLTTRAGGLGVNLQTADTVIIFDSDWNPQADLQAADRAHRIGQQREVRILRFITANSVEQNVLDRANYKRGLEQKIVEAGMFDEKSKDSERQARLRDLLREQDDGEDQDKEELPTPEELNQVLSRGEHEIEVFKQVDDERKIEINNRSSLMEVEELPDWLTDIDPDLIRKPDQFGADQILEELGPRRAAAKKHLYDIDRYAIVWKRFNPTSALWKVQSG